MRQRYRDQMEQHPLRREIVVTQVVNELVNNAGHHLLPPAVRGDRRVGRRSWSGPTSWPGRSSAPASCIDEIDALDNQIDADVQTRMRLEVRTLVERASRWLVNNRRPPMDIEATVEFFGVVAQQVVAGAARRC